MNENRSKIWDDYIKQGGYFHNIIKHSFTEYNRYHEAELIDMELLKQHQDTSKMKILDFGCGVGDYGIYLLRAGAKLVHFYDYPRAVKFVEYRLKREKLTSGHIVDADKEPLLWNYDLVIFGEVLEHLDNPYETLEYCVSNDTKYVFTSSYPYRSEDPDDPYWSNHDHDDKARLQIPDCKRLLENNYNFVKFGGELRLWRKI